MRWGIFSLSQMPDQSGRVEDFERDLAQFELAEQLGYDSVWIAEHLFSTYGVVTSTQVLAAAIAQRTKTIRIGTAVVVIPFNHPLRTASDFALVDVLSHGRLDFGIGRAYQPHEFTGLGLPMEESRAMFEEGIDIVLKSWTNETVAYEGKYWTIPQPVEMLPKPVQTPHPPVWQATVSPESFEQAARHGWHLQMATPFTYRTYREQWMEKLEESLGHYEATCSELGKDPKDAKRMVLLPFFCHENGDTAREIFGQHVQWFYDKVTNNQLAMQGQPSNVKGYELTMSEGIRTRGEGYLQFDKLYELGATICDDPDTCIDKLREYKKRFGVTDFVLWSNIGGISHEHSDAAMRLAMERIIPHV